MELVAQMSPLLRNALTTASAGTQKSQYCRKHSARYATLKMVENAAAQLEREVPKSGVNNARVTTAPPIGGLRSLHPERRRGTRARASTRRSKEPIVECTTSRWRGTGNHPSLLVIRTKGRRRSYYVLGRCSSPTRLLERA